MDYQTDALYGDNYGNGGLDATMLNPGALHPNDWETVLTNGVSHSALNGLNGWIANQVQAGQIANAQAAGGLSIRGTGNGVVVNGGMVPWLVVGAILYAVLK